MDSMDVMSVTVIVPLDSDLVEIDMVDDEMNVENITISG